MQTLDWSNLTHAYGSASNVPALLLQASTAVAPRDYRDEPWFSLWSALCHQGNVYLASYAAVPELVAVAESRATELAVARECLLLAASIEIERALPEGSAPPKIPTAIRTEYERALVRGAVLASRLLKQQALDADSERALLIIHAALRGDVEEARRLADPLDEDEE